MALITEFEMVIWLLIDTYPLSAVSTFTTLVHRPLHSSQPAANSVFGHCGRTSKTIIKMQPAPNRLGLGLRPPLPSFGQGPSMSALAQQQHMLHNQFVPPQPKAVTLFIGSISGGITDSFLNSLLSVGSIVVWRHAPDLNFPDRLVVQSLPLSDSLPQLINLKVSVLPNFRMQTAHCVP